MILAIDSATKSGWAFCQTRGTTHYWQHGVADGRSRSSRMAVLEAAEDAGCTAVVIEDAYRGPNTKTYGLLKEIRGLWMADAETVGLKVLEPVLASVWQKNMLGDCAGETKAAAMVIAKRLGASPKTFDEADAVCLCEYVTRLKAVEGRAA